jgi:tetratricopeptide (TPR) repeat protein
MIQSNIAENIVSTLKMKLSPEDEVRFHKEPTKNLEAYNLYLQGRFFWNKRTGKDMEKAIELFEMALEIDSNFALAYAGLAEAYAVLPWFSSVSRKEAFASAMHFAQQALKIDDTIAEAYASIAWAKHHSWDFEEAEINYFEEAEINYRKAVKSNPNYATGHQWYAKHLMRMNRMGEAVAEIERALELDPVSYIIKDNAGEIYLVARQYDKAIEVIRKAKEIDPNRSWLYLYSGRTFLHKSMYTQALEEFKKAKQLSGGQHLDSDLWTGIVYLNMGKGEEAKELFDALENRMQKESVSNYSKALYYAALGDQDEVFYWLNKMYEDRELDLFSFIRSPIFDSIHFDPRYNELLKKLGIDK